MGGLRRRNDAGAESRRPRHHGAVQVSRSEPSCVGQLTPRWKQFDQLVGVIPPGGSLGIDDKAFVVS
jgi:hypothetical protein